MAPKSLLAKILKQMFDKNGEIFSKSSKIQAKPKQNCPRNFFFNSYIPFIKKWLKFQNKSIPFSWIRVRDKLMSCSNSWNMAGSKRGSLANLWNILWQPWTLASSNRGSLAKLWRKYPIFWPTWVRNIWFFSPLVPSKREKNILVLLSLYIFWGKCVYFSIFEW